MTIQLFPGAKIYLSEQVPQCVECGAHMIVMSPGGDAITDQLAGCLDCGYKQPFPFPITEAEVIVLPENPTAEQVAMYASLPGFETPVTWGDPDPHWWVRNI